MAQMSSPQLEDKIHEALRQWHHGSTQTSPLGHLFLFQQNQRTGENNHRATNDILLQLLDRLKANQSQLALLIRLRFLDQLAVTAVANRLNIAEGTVYKYQKQAISTLALMLAQWEQQVQTEGYAELEQRLHLPSETELFGIRPTLNKLLDLLTTPGPSWLFSLEGLGGIGKTALANTLVRELALSNQFKAVGWVSAKQTFFNPAVGVQAIDHGTLDVDSLVDQLLVQLHPEPPPTTSPEEKLTALKILLKSAPYFIVIDNLESMTDYQALLPVLRGLTNPSRILLTCRISLHHQADIHCVTITQLCKNASLDLLRYEAEVRHIPKLAQASSAQLESIYEVVGGNPLALKLVVGQTRILPLPHILENLRQAQGKSIDALYTYIYWQAWHALDPVSQQVLLAMPLVQGGNLTQLSMISKFDMELLGEALHQLTYRNLVEASGGLEEMVYRIHRLTETFLLTEVIRWQSDL
ncbi:MAG: hypothetical protein KDJ65_29270 [Anaerolineae bacterium]|nr:hypothetical protein [Anaerolineae bacterium]